MRRRSLCAGRRATRLAGDRVLHVPCLGSMPYMSRRAPVLSAIGRVYRASCARSAGGITLLNNVLAQRRRTAGLIKPSSGEKSSSQTIPGRGMLSPLGRAPLATSDVINHWHQNASSLAAMPPDLSPVLIFWLGYYRFKYLASLLLMSKRPAFIVLTYFV